MDLFEGRPISYASPLFYMPIVHDALGTQLGITAHDMNVHCPIDWQSPYVEQCIRLGRSLLNIVMNEKIHEADRKIVLNMVVQTLDRAVFPSKMVSNMKQQWIHKYVIDPAQGLADANMRDKIVSLCRPFLPYS